jgi:hypothetical protein
MAKLLPHADLQTAVDAYATHGSRDKAANALGIKPTTLQHRLKLAATAGVKPNKSAIRNPEAEIKRLTAELKAAQAESADAKAVKDIIGSMAHRSSQTATPEWVSQIRNKASSPGVPTLFLSDFHWGEVVHPSQVNGVNQYNLRLAHERLKTCVDGAIHLLEILDPKMDYPGIVMPLGGDMVSGDIHEELAESNELATIPTVLDMERQIAAAITRAADVFGAVFLPCVTGNHGRNTKKIRAKDRHHTSFDWLLYQLLAKRFEGDKRVTFLIPDGPDAAWKVYGTRYNLTHGDQFRGGDGMIGALGPIIRGDHKKRSRNGQIDLAYDVLLLGHWHQYMHLTRLIVNGSLKGYDEYANSNNFGFEVPQQALWVTHPKYGITYRMPVYVDRKRTPPKTSWVSVPRAA